MNKVRNICRLSGIELLQLIRNSKMIVLVIFLIFINVQIIEPLRLLYVLMGHKVSVFEPFIALGNSGVIVLILPLLFITLMADFPREGNCQYFCQIRCSKKVWVGSQVLYAFESAIFLTLFIVIATIIVSMDYVNWNLDYSYAVTNFVAVYPERAGEYTAQLIPENLYNQISYIDAVIHTGLLLILYLSELALFILLFALCKTRIIGIFLDVVLILLGAIVCAGRLTYMWILPMAHTITWLHYEKYERKPILPLSYSYLYLGIIDILLIVCCIGMSKRYKGV